MLQLQVLKFLWIPFLYPGIQCSNCGFTVARTVLVFCSTKLSLTDALFQSERNSK